MDKPDISESANSPELSQNAAGQDAQDTQDTLDNDDNVGDDDTPADDDTQDSDPQVGLYKSLNPLAWLFVVLGTISITWPVTATIAVEQWIAVFFGMSGIGGLLFWWSFRDAGANRMGLLTAALALIAGIVLAVSPLAGAATLTMVLVAILIVEGLLGIVLALRWQRLKLRWSWPLLNAIVTLVLAAMIVSGWPSSANWVIGLLFGLNLLSIGITLLMVGRLGP